MAADRALLEFVDSSVYGVWLWDLKSPANCWANPRLWAFLGYQPAEQEKVNCLSLLRQKSADALRRLIEKGDVDSADLEVSYAGLHSMEVKAILKCRVIAGGKLLAGHWPAGNEALYFAPGGASVEEIVQKFDHLTSHLNNSPLGIVEYTKDLAITQWSKTCEDIFEWTREEILNRKISAFNLIYEEDMPATAKIAEELMTGAVDGNVSFNRNYTKNGRVVHCVWYNSTIKDETGQVTSVMSLVQDITREKETEGRLRESERALDTFFENSLYGFFFMMLDKPIAWNDKTNKEKALEYVISHQRITKVNKAILDQYRATEEQIIGLTPLELFEGDADAAKAVWRDFFDKGLLKVDSKKRRFDGSEFWLKGEYVCLYSQQGEITGHFGIESDVSDQKEAEQALKASESALKETQSIAKMGGATYDLVKRDLSVSEGLLELIGYSRSDKIDAAKALSDILHPADVDKVKGWVKKNYSEDSDQLAPIEFRLIKKDGAEIWVSVQGKIAYLDHRPVSIVLTVQDISERKAIEEKIIASEKRFKSLVENSKDAVSIFTAEGNVLYLSPSVEKILGYTREDVAGTNLGEMVHADDLPGLTAAFEEALSRPGQLIKTPPYRVRHQSGRWRWIEGGMTNLRDDPHIGGLVNNFVDVTERVEYAELLKKANERLKTAQRIARIGYWEWDWQENTTYWSEEMYRLCGSRKVMSEKQLFSQIHPDDQVRFSKYREALNHATEGDSIEIRFYRKKLLRTFVLRTVPILDAARKVIGLEGTLQDITERKEKELEILRLSTFPSENPNPVLRINKSGKVTYCNKAGEILWPSKSSGGLKELPEALRELSRQVFETQNVIRREITINENPYAFTMAPSEAGEFVNAYGLDISEQKRIETALRDSEYLLSEVGRIAKIGGWEFDPATKKGKWTREVASLHELPADLPASLNFKLSFFTPSSRKTVSKAIEDALNLGEPFDLEVQIKTSRNNLRWVRTIGIPVVADNGKVKLRGAMQDITAIKEVKNNILLEKELSDNIINSLPGAFYLYDQTGKFLRWNKNFEHVTGYSAEEIGNMHPLQFFDDDEKELLAAKIANVFVAGEDSVDAHFLLKNGKKIPYYFTGKSIQYQGETCLVGVGIDTSEKKKAELALKESEAQYRSLFENMNEGFAYCEMIYKNGEPVDFRYHNTNAAFESITGLKNAAGKTVTELIPGIEKANKNEIALLARVSETGEPERFEVYVEGLRRWLSSSVFSPKKGFFVSMFQDITERKKAELAIESSEQKFRALVEQSLTGIYIFDRKKFLYVNDHFAEIFGYTVEEVLASLKPIDVVTKDEHDRVNSLIESRLNKEVESVHYTARGVKRNGDKIWVEIHGSNIELEGRQVITGTVLDITERVNTEESIKSLLKKTTEQNSRLKEFSFITSHNIRSSVSNLMGLTELLLKGTPKKEYVEMIRKSTLKLDETIRNINEILHFETEFEAQKRTNCNLLAAVQNVIELNNKVIKEKEVAFSIKIAPDLSVKCIPAYLDSVLQNLITNAIKYGITSNSNQIVIEAKKRGKQITITVQDFGTGIDLEKNNSKLFKLGARFHSSIEGHGMGLYMSKRQVESMGGSISVESAVNKGSKFTIKLDA